MARIDFRELVNHGDVRQIIHARAAQLFGPWNSEETELGHLLHVVPGEATVEVVGAAGRFNDVAGEVANHLAHLEVMLGEIQTVVHGLKVTPPQSSPARCGDGPPALPHSVSSRERCFPTTNPAFATGSGIPRPCRPCRLSRPPGNRPRAWAAVPNAARAARPVCRSPFRTRSSRR